MAEKDLNHAIPPVTHDLFFAHLQTIADSVPAEALEENVFWWSNENVDQYFKNMSAFFAGPICRATKIDGNVQGTLLYDADKAVYHSFVPCNQQEIKNEQ